MPNQSRYPGTRPFLEEHRHLFFGRAHDTKKLSNLVVLEKMVVLFGKSGYGKSSLLNAAVIPNLRDNKQHFPIKIRLMPPEGTTKGPKTKPIEIVKFHLEKENRATSSFLSDKLNVPKVLPTDITAILWYNIKLIQLSHQNSEATSLFFYQFEELFRYFNDSEVDEFGRSMAALLHSKPPDTVLELIRQNLSAFSDDELKHLYEPLNLKIVFSVSSDHLNLLDKLKPSLPEIYKYTYELKALDETQAKEALEEPAKKEGKFSSPKFTYSDETITKILEYLKGKIKEGIELENQDIETFQLQLIGQYAEERIIGTAEKAKRKAKWLKQEESKETVKFEFSLKDLGEPGKILKKFYKKVIGGLDFSKRAKARNLIQEGLIIGGNRVPMSTPAIERDYSVFEDTLGKLEDKHLLRSEAKVKDGRNAKSYEISHYNLIKPIQEAAARRKLSRLWALVILLLLIIAGLIGWVVYLSNLFNPETPVRPVTPESGIQEIKKEGEFSNGLIINALGTATVSPAKGPAPHEVRFTFTKSDTIGEVRIIRYYWEFGDGTARSNDDPDLRHRYEEPNVFIARLTVICTDPERPIRTEEVILEVTGLDSIPDSPNHHPPIDSIQEDVETITYKPPIAKALVAPKRGEVPLTVAFKGSNANEIGLDTQYEWKFGDGDTIKVASFERTFTEVGTYDVEFGINVAGVKSDTIVRITVEPAPIPPPLAKALVAPKRGEVPLTVAFKGSNANESGLDTQYEWKFGDGDTIKVASFERTFTEVGTYDVEFGINVAGVKSDTIVRITVEPATIPPPLAKASADPLSGRVPLTVAFKGSNANEGESDIQYEWDFKDGPISTEQNPVHIFTSAGTYEVQLTLEDNSERSHSTSLTITALAADTIPIKVGPVSLAPAVVGMTWMERFIRIQEQHLPVNTTSRNERKNWRIPPDSLNLTVVLLPKSVAPPSTKDGKAALLFFFDKGMKKGKFANNSKPVKRKVYKFPVEIDTTKSKTKLRSERFNIKSLIKQARKDSKNKDTTTTTIITRKYMGPGPDRHIVEYQQSTYEQLVSLLREKDAKGNTLNMYYTLFPFENFDKTSQKEIENIYEQLKPPG